MPLTGSKKTVEIMNKMNNLCNYDLVCAIETAQVELALELSEKLSPLPQLPKDASSSVLVRFW